MTVPNFTIQLHDLFVRITRNEKLSNTFFVFVLLEENHKREKQNEKDF